MAYRLAPDTFTQIMTTTGVPAVGYTLESYIYNTSTPTAMFSDASGTSLGTSCTLNSRGAPQTGGGAEVSIYLNTALSSGYKFILKDAGGATVRTYAGPVYPVPAPSGDSAVGASSQSMSAFITTSWGSTDQVYVLSFYGGWAATVAGPKGASIWHHDGTTGGTPTTNTTDDIRTAMQGGRVISADGKGWRLDTDQVISVYMFGIVPDSSGDATANTYGFQSAQIFCEGSDPIPLYLGGGTFYFERLTISDRCTMYGDGMWATHIISTTTNAAHDAMRAVGTNGNEITWCDFKGFRCTGSGSNRHGFYAEFCGRFTFDDVWMYGHGQAGFYYGNSWAAKFIRCQASGNGSDGLTLADGPQHFNNGTRIISGAYNSNGADGIRNIGVVSTSNRESVVIDGPGCTSNVGAGIRVFGSGWEVKNHFLEYNGSGGIVLGSASVPAIGGVIGPGSLDGADPDAAYAATYQGIVYLNAQHIDVAPQMAARCTQVHWLDDTYCYNIKISAGNKMASVTGNWITFGSEVVAGGAEDVLITASATGRITLGVAPRDTIQVESGVSGYRLNITGNGSNRYDTLHRWQNSGTTMMTLFNGGPLQLTTVTKASLTADFANSAFASSLMMVSDPAAGKGRLCYHDSSVWRYVSDDSAV